jgi:hypothetical protein
MGMLRSGLCCASGPAFAAAAAAAAADYHPDKHSRMKAVFKYYLQKDLTALTPFPGGSEPGT